MTAKQLEHSRFDCSSLSHSKIGADAQEGAFGKLCQGWNSHCKYRQHESCLLSFQHFVFFQNQQHSQCQNKAQQFPFHVTDLLPRGVPAAVSPFSKIVQAGQSDGRAKRSAALSEKQSVLPPAARRRERTSLRSRHTLRRSPRHTGPGSGAGPGVSPPHDR